MQPDRSDGTEEFYEQLKAVRLAERIRSSEDNARKAEALADPELRAAYARRYFQTIGVPHTQRHDLIASLLDRKGRRVAEIVQEHAKT